MLTRLARRALARGRLPVPPLSRGHYLLLVAADSRAGYFFRFAACVSADPATLLAALEDFGSLRIFEAFDATWGDVFSLVVRFGVVAITISFKPAFRAGWYYKLLTLHRAIGVGTAGSR